MTIMIVPSYFGSAMRPWSVNTNHVEPPLAGRMPTEQGEQRHTLWLERDEQHRCPNSSMVVIVCLSAEESWVGSVTFWAK